MDKSNYYLIDIIKINCSSKKYNIVIDIVNLKL